MEFPRSADEHIYSSEINVFKEIGVANFLSSEYFHQAEIGRNAVQANFSRLKIFIRQK